MRLDEFEYDMNIISGLADNPTQTAEELKKKFDEGGLAIQEFINNMIKNMHNAIWPIGSIYMSTNKNDPNTLLGGTWERIENAFLFGASDKHPLGESGGEENHVLTIEEMPKHTHEQAEMQYGNDWLDKNGQWSAASSGSVTHEYMTKEAGGDEAHNNMPPYLAVSIWKRVA